MARGVLRFFFDYGAGGCLWAGDTETRDRLGVGPVDAAHSRVDGTPAPAAMLPLSEATRRLRDQLDHQHASYLNPLYPLDPSLWSQGLCDQFNTDIDRLLTLLRAELAAEFTIMDEQPRYAEDGRLADYLAQNPGLDRMGAFGGATPCQACAPLTPPHP